MFVSVAFNCHFQLLAPLLTLLKRKDLLAAVSQSVCVYVGMQENEMAGNWVFVQFRLCAGVDGRC